MSFNFRYASTCVAGRASWWMSGPTLGLRHLTMLCLLLGSCIYNSLWAAESLTDQFRINGFGTAGIAEVDGPTGWGYRRDIWQPYNRSPTRTDLDSRIGLQINYTPNENVEAVVQGLASRRGEASIPSDSIALAFVAYRPNPDWTLRVGRVNFDAYLLSEHRDVGFTYQFARPPLEFYSQLPNHLNGADLSRVWNSGAAVWRAKAFFGSTTGVSTSDRIGVKPLFGIVVSHEATGLLLRASLIQGRLSNAPAELQPLTDALSQISRLPVAVVVAQADALQSQLQFRDVTSIYSALGAEYDQGLWLWSGEFTHLSGIRGNNSGYASLGRHVGPVSIFAIASAMRSSQRVAAAPPWAAELTPVIGPMAAQQTQYLAIAAADAVNAFSSRQHTGSLGARWNVTTQVALKTQWDYVTTDANGGSLWSRPSLQPAHANVVSFLIDFVF